MKKRRQKPRRALQNHLKTARKSLARGLEVARPVREHSFSFVMTAEERLMLQKLANADGITAVSWLRMMVRRETRALERRRRAR